MKIFLAGEGPNELGGWARTPAYREPSPDRGVLEAILRRLQPTGWTVVGAQLWSRIRKYQAGGFATAEERNVRGVVLTASESGCDVVAFSRDRDRDAERERQIEAIVDAIVTAAEPGQPFVIGGIAREALESWILSLRGMTDAEQTRQPKERLRNRLRDENRELSTEEMVAIVNDCDLSAIPEGADSLRRWIDRGRQFFPSGATAPAR